MTPDVWFIYQKQQQSGPFTLEQIQQMYGSGMIDVADGYLFTAGWKDWRSVSDCIGEIAIDDAVAPTKGEPVPRTQRRVAGPRASFAGRIILHNDGQLVIGGGVNISITGVFIETKDRLFTIGESLKMTIKSEEFGVPFNVTAKVIRYNADSKYAVGYGLMFEDIDEVHIERIREVVDRLNGSSTQLDADDSKLAR
jgi:hypothetical protein